MTMPRNQPMMGKPPDEGSNEAIGFVSPDEIGASARNGAVWSAAQIITRNGLSLVITAILARILLPSDYGLVGMVTTLTALLQVFADMGLSWATVRSQTLNRAQVSALFWINIAVGLLLWGAMAAAAPVLADFYDEPAITQIAMVSGISFLLSGIAVQPMALLIRQMNFRGTAIIEVVGLLVGAAVALELAFSGAGYWALVAQLPAQALVRVALSIPWSGIKIYAPRRTPGLGSMISFGGLMVVNGILIYLMRNLDTILVGKVWGASELGFYNRAYFLMMLPSMLAAGVLSHLMVSSLANLQDDKPRFANAYRRSLRMVAYVGMPLALGLALTAGPAVELVYGPGWEQVVTLLAWLSLAGITQPIYNTNGWLFTACGKAGLYLVITLKNAIILCTVFFLAIEHGTVALARSYGLVMGLILPLPTLWLAHKAAGIPYLPSLGALVPVAVLNAAMGVTVWMIGVGGAALGWNALAVFPAQVVTGGTLYIALTPLLLPDMLRQDLAPFLNKFKRRMNRAH